MLAIGWGLPAPTRDCVRLAPLTARLFRSFLGGLLRRTFLRDSFRVSPSYCCLLGRSLLLCRRLLGSRLLLRSSLLLGGRFLFRCALGRLLRRSLLCRSLLGRFGWCLFCCLSGSL